MMKIFFPCNRQCSLVLPRFSRGTIEFASGNIKVVSSANSSKLFWGLFDKTDFSATIISLFFTWVDGTEIVLWVVEHDTENDFTSDDCLLQLSKFFRWVNFFLCVFRAFKPILPCWNCWLLQILQQNVFSPAFPSTHFDISGYSSLFSHSTLCLSSCYFHTNLKPNDKITY